MSKIGEMVECNPQVKLQKGASYNVVDIDSIAVGNRTVLGKHPEIYNGQSGCHFANGDTVLARITPCLENGKFAQVRCETQKGFGSTELFVFRGKKDKTDNDYVYYLIAMPFVRKMAANSMTGASGRQRADLEFIKKIEWSFPPLPTQRKIASILSAYDNLIENNNKRIKILEQMAENLYKEWFVRFRFPGHETTPFENGIPKGWKVEKIKNCVKRLPFGKTYKEAELEKEGSVIVIDQSTEPFIGYHDDVAAHQASANNPIILFGDHSCKFVLMTRNFSLGENIVPFVSYNDEIVNPYYLFFATHKIIETTEYKRHWGEFVNKKILIPSIDLQKEFARMSIPLKLQLEQLLIENQNLIKQRDLLLPRLMSGKLAV